MSTGATVTICTIWVAVAVCGWAFAPILLVVAPIAYFSTQTIMEHDTP